MDRSRPRGGTREIDERTDASSVPASSRLTVNKKRNRRRPVSLWSRLPRPRAVADACGRAVRRGVPAIIASCVVAVLGTGAWLGYWFVTSSDRFAIDDIQVRGNQTMTPDQIRAALPIAIGDNVFTADLGEAVQRLRAEPWIATADARRILPSTIEVTVREHRAAAVIELATGEAYLADADGHPFKRITGTEGDGFPRVTGIDRGAYSDPAIAAHQVVGALDVLRRWREAERPAVDEIHLDGRGTALLHGDLVIQLGQLDGDAVTDRLKTFDLVWTALGDSERTKVRRIHLDARPDHVTVAFAST